MKHGDVFNKWVIPSHMRYHDSWDWLMPVVEEINRMDDELSGSITIDHSHVFLHRLIGDKHLPLLDWGWQNKGLIASVYNAVVEFVKWYNEQKKQSREPIRRRPWLVTPSFKTNKLTFKLTDLWQQNLI